MTDYICSKCKSKGRSNFSIKYIYGPLHNEQKLFVCDCGEALREIEEEKDYAPIQNDSCS